MTKSQQQLLAEIQQQQAELRARLDAEQETLTHLAKRLWAQQESEKAKLSRELHDGVGQLLTGLTRRLHGVSGDYPELRELAELAEMALADVRQLSRLMSPTILEDLGLQPALKWLCRSLFEHEDMHCRCDINIQGQVPDDVAILLFRITQEALVNAIKHSEATEVSLSLQQHNQTLRLDVADNGQGYDKLSIEPGIGLTSMQDRATAFGATFNIRSRPAQGTHITMTVAL
ncbi:sensor histidine kinase [Planctobacterium marinum]|uniref:sensor histidine kinase n=1 Tax=Planctobacterium marinum TaxID=1631968 RepID=UPI001E3D483C|nr:sensor histidine kinase [Planctobacterium marinum]MCC2605203.1 sensor histidine kinase [Planctobacterium marinum]